MMGAGFANFEIVTLTLYLLGGQLKYVDTEDIAVKANELAPRRFAWRKYPEQINIEIVRTALSDAKKEKYGTLLLGSHRQGWLLSQTGLDFCKAKVEQLGNAKLSRPALTPSERHWHGREKERMLASKAFDKLTKNCRESITTEDAEAFFRVDDYVTGTARIERITRIRNSFGDDPELGEAVRLLAGKVRGI
jgi:hypothetical protein